MKSTNQQNLSLSNSRSFIYFQNKKELNALNIELTSLVRVPIQNSNTFSLIKDSSISSLIAYSDEIQNKAKKEGIVHHKYSFNHSLNTNNNIIQYLQPTSSIQSLPLWILEERDKSSLPTSSASLPSPITNWAGVLIEKKNKIFDIKQNTQSFIKFNSNDLPYNYFTLKKKYYINN